MGKGGGCPRCRRDSGDLHGPGWHAERIRHRTHRGDLLRGFRAGHRLRRREAARSLRGDFHHRACRCGTGGVNFPRSCSADPRAQGISLRARHSREVAVLIPCIDLQQGKAVQLLHGRKRELAGPDVMSLLLKFQKYKWLHVIDLDAAMGKGNNRELARTQYLYVAKRFGMKVRVGGGIRTVRRAEEITKWGARQVIVGSAAFKNGKINASFLRKLGTRVGRSAIVIALDTAQGRIVTAGWREKLPIRAEDVIEQPEPFCAEFL